MSLADSIIDYEKYKYEHFPSVVNYSTAEELRCIAWIAKRGNKKALQGMLALVDIRHWDKGVDVGQVRIALQQAVGK